MNRIQEVRSLGQSVWMDYIRRSMLKSDEMKQWLATGITGLTSNPSIFEKAITGSTDYDDALLEMSAAGKDARQIMDNLTVEDIRSAADLLREAHETSGGNDGYASLECNPLLAGDTEATVREAKGLFSALDRPNVMVKVAATPQGIPAIKQLIGEGVSVNVTLIFSLDVYRQVREAYIEGLELLAKHGGYPGKVFSVASFFLSRVDSVADRQIEHMVSLDQRHLEGLMGRTAISNAKVAYQAFKETFASEQFKKLQAKGARVQRPLWASTSTKNPAYGDLHYVEPLIGPDTINTLPPATINALLDHGRVEPAIERGVIEARQTLKALSEAGLDLELLTSQLLSDGVRIFAEAHRKMITGIEYKLACLKSDGRPSRPVFPGSESDKADIERVMVSMRQGNAIPRIWQLDHTVWKQDPKEIRERLGWLNVTDSITEQLSNLMDFARQVRDEGYTRVVLLGMGGSSLGAEVLRKSFGKQADYPGLMVLDSTVPASVRRVEESVNMKKCLFLVSSKSGTTIETTSLYSYFKNGVDKVLGQHWSGKSFVAITDPGTSLAQLAHDNKFMKCFLAPPDIGGRYSVLSGFGLVPAALAGIDIAALVDRGERMRHACAGCVDLEDNPGARLGAIMGAFALKGRDKLTLVCSPAIESFGLWAEQLIAESTGKEGKGIIPVVDEPVLDAQHYGDDRLFVYLRLIGDRNASVDKAMDRLEAAGQPVLRLQLHDLYDLGAEFFRWEFATAVAGAILGINPFDQPDVQESKTMSTQILRHYQVSGHLMQTEESFSLDKLFSLIRPGCYVAIQAYLSQTAAKDKALADLRKSIMRNYRVATTAAYGPRYLHSTGQLHKGGPDKGLFLQLTEEYRPDYGIPGHPFSLQVLTEAEAVGDFQALQSKGRQVIRIDLGESPVEEIHKLMKQPV